MGRKKLYTEQYAPVPEYVSVRGYLDVNSGEYIFIAFSNKRYIKAKGLYDALSIFGINYDKAKVIVSEVSQELDATYKFRVNKKDYTQFALDQQFTHDNETILRYP
jgi:hypothetical protein